MEHLKSNLWDLFKKQKNQNEKLSIRKYRCKSKTDIKIGLLFLMEYLKGRIWDLFKKQLPLALTKSEVILFPFKNVGIKVILT